MSGSMLSMLRRLENGPEDDVIISSSGRLDGERLGDLNFSELTPAELEVTKQARSDYLQRTKAEFLAKTGGKSISFEHGCKECGQICYNGGPFCETCLDGD